MQSCSIKAARHTVPSSTHALRYLLVIVESPGRALRVVRVGISLLAVSVACWAVSAHRRVLVACSYVLMHSQISSASLVALPHCWYCFR